MAKTQALPSMPLAWSPAYTEEDKAQVGRIIAFLTDELNVEAGWSRASLARTIGTSNGTVHDILAGKYPSPPAKHLAAMLKAIDRDQTRQAKRTLEIPHVETTVHRAVRAACLRAHVHRNFAVLTGFVGTGKTTGAKEYRDQNPDTVFLIEAIPSMGVTPLLNRLVRAIGAKVPRGSKASNDDKMEAIIEALSPLDALIILDEAEKVQETTLEYLRRIRDQAQVGIALLGTPDLEALVRDPRGRFGQISSRVGFWPASIQAITVEDAYALARAALSTLDLQPSEEVLAALNEECDGSARVLCESLIPALDDYVLKRGKELTAEAVVSVARTVLGLRKARRA